MKCDKVDTCKFLSEVNRQNQMLRSIVQRQKDLIERMQAPFVRRRDEQELHIKMKLN